jgi:hypothetical protein
VKRIIFLLLVVALPFRMAWAAGLDHCPPSAGMADGAATIAAPAHTLDVHPHGEDGHVHGDDGSAHGSHPSGAGHEGGARLECNLFQFVALEPPAGRPHSLPMVGTAVYEREQPPYESHIPTGPERPNWRLTARIGETFFSSSKSRMS